eukprot:TRINITY_DN3887_c0_g1_i1.p1 TRINITY_DN3887_c0_g1~~TRINITY_DN3887_c0_g1_i1.p1  ORF type:complete len:412 (-),score=140.24 TRINITY_DN3887_c0_g1_i1:52-1287(-)
MSSSEDEAQEVTDLTNGDVVNKYKFAAEVANKVIGAVAEQCVVGKKLCDLCQMGDAMIEQLVASRFSKGKPEKGVAFPTSICINNTAGNFSPLMDDTIAFQTNDIAKIDLGVHIDGYIAVVAHTLVVTDGSDELSGPKGDVVKAAKTALDTAVSMLRPGVKNTEITSVIQSIADAYHVNTVEGVLSHEMKRFVIDGNNVIIERPTNEHHVDEFAIGDNEVYAIDIMMSTGEGKPKELEAKTTIYKRSSESQYRLKMQASRYLFNEISHRFPTFPFALRSLDPKRGKLGITEMAAHQMVDPYPVLQEKPEAVVAHFKTTVLVKKKPTAVTACPVRPSHATSTYTWTAPVAAPAPAAAAPKKKKKQHKKKKAATVVTQAPGAATPAAAAATPATQTPTQTPNPAATGPAPMET